MFRKHIWSVVALSFVSLTGGWVYLNLFTTQATRRSDQLHEIIDEVEKDYGVYDPETARDQSAIVRAKRAAVLAQTEAERQIALRDSLTALMRSEQEALGGYNDYNPEPKQPPRARVTEDGVLVMDSGGN